MRILVWAVWVGIWHGVRSGWRIGRLAYWWGRALRRQRRRVRPVGRVGPVGRGEQTVPRSPFGRG